MLRFAVLLCAGEPESVTVKVIAAPLTAVVGVPVIAPEVASESPAGSEPLVMDQL